MIALEGRHTHRHRGLLLACFLLGGCGDGGGGGGGGGGGDAASTPPPASGAAPALVQFNTHQTEGNAGENNSTLQFNAPTKAGNALWVATTLSDFAGVHTISVTDSQGNTFVPLDQEDDGAPGTQTVAHFYASNIVGDAATPDIITVVWSNENYKGVLITEISGTTQSPLVGHAGNIQDGLSAGTNNVTSGPIDVTAAQTPALLLALSVNTSGGSSDTGGSGAPGPSPGTGLTQVSTVWNFGAYLGTFATGTLTAAAPANALFNAPDTDSYVTLAVVFH